MLTVRKRGRGEGEKSGNVQYDMLVVRMGDAQSCLLVVVCVRVRVVLLALVKLSFVSG